MMTDSNMAASKKNKRKFLILLFKMTNWILVVQDGKLDKHISKVIFDLYNERTELEESRK